LVAQRFFGAGGQKLEVVLQSAFHDSATFDLGL
jgi:hypothetical protein